MRHFRILSLLMTTVAVAVLAGCAGMPGGGAMNPGMGTGSSAGTPRAPGTQQPATLPPPQWQTPGPRGGACNAAPAQGFVGQAGTASVTEKARVASGAAMARVLRPNQPVTREYNPERLNLLLDDKGQIKAVTCS